MDSIVKVFQKHGYSFASQEKTLKSSMYYSKISSYTSRGISCIFRWGLSLDRDKTIMNDDIQVPDSISKLSKNANNTYY